MSLALQASATPSSFTYNLSFLSLLNIGADKEEDYISFLDLPLVSGKAHVLVPDCTAYSDSVASLPAGIQSSLSLLGCSPADFEPFESSAAMESLMYCSFEKVRTLSRAGLHIGRQSMACMSSADNIRYNRAVWCYRGLLHVFRTTLYSVGHRHMLLSSHGSAKMQEVWPLPRVTGIA